MEAMLAAALFVRRPGHDKAMLHFSALIPGVVNVKGERHDWQQTGSVWKDGGRRK
jgi:hypothetical protein